ncbi:hypothetical protein HQN90_09175 [Paenibacillus alba]|uniref:hypothetical protein n=1 Tax=Paenibacillus alba TaxID=1197127 RepID=UPI0015678B34|nr:hypothetical protein [Paenibacillus alba]NQX66297.1 hypothetical protein [Paenibacillus alba]
MPKKSMTVFFVKTVVLFFGLDDRCSVKKQLKPPKRPSRRRSISQPHSSLPKRQSQREKQHLQREKAAETAKKTVSAPQEQPAILEPAKKAGSK